RRHTRFSRDWSSDVCSSDLRREHHMETASLPSDLVRLHCHNNRTTAQNWERYASHRRQVTELLRERADTELMILGAGNCNDVDQIGRASCRERVEESGVDET